MLKVSVFDLNAAWIRCIGLPSEWFETLRANTLHDLFGFAFHLLFTVLDPLLEICIINFEEVRAGGSALFEFSDLLDGKVLHYRFLVLRHFLVLLFAFELIE